MTKPTASLSDHHMLKVYPAGDELQIAAQFAVYQGACLLLERAIRQKGCRYANLPPGEGFSLGFVAAKDSSGGFWLPTGRPAYTVSVEENMYENDAMDAATFGMGLTLLAVNHYAWFLSEQPGQQQLAEQFSNRYLELRDWAFDLSEAGYLDGESLAGFID